MIENRQFKLILQGVLREGDQMALSVHNQWLASSGDGDGDSDCVLRDEASIAQVMTS